MAAKTTIELAPALLAEARQTARARGMTLKALLEEGLRLALERSHPAQRFRLREVTADLGRPLFSSGAELRELTYEGRGGNPAKREKQRRGK